MAILRAVPPAKVAAMQRAVLWVRDYFVYKDMYNPSASSRAELLSAGRPRQDAFLLIALALEGRARALGKLVDVPEWRQRNRELLGWGADGLLGAGVAGRGSTADGGAGSQAAAAAADRADAAGQPRREADS